MFRLPGGITGFLLLHFPLYIVGLYGLVMVYHAQLAGFILSLLVATAGVFAFCIHTYFLHRGGSQFDTAISKLILAALLGISILQISITIYLLVSDP